MFVLVLGKPSFIPIGCGGGGPIPSSRNFVLKFLELGNFQNKTTKQREKIANPSIQIPGPKNIQHNEKIVYFPNEFIYFGISVVL